MVSFSGISNLLKSSSQGAKLIGKNSKGIEVYRQILSDGKVVTTSFKNGMPLKSVTKESISFPATGMNPRAFAHQSSVQNHLTGDTFNVYKVEDQLGKTFWQRSTPEKRTFYELFNGKIGVKGIEKTQPSGGNLLVEKRPSGTFVRANNYVMPNDKIVTGEFGHNPGAWNFSTPRYFTAESGGQMYSGNKLHYTIENGILPKNTGVHLNTVK